MNSSAVVLDSHQNNTDELVHLAIAEKVRADSSDAKLTPIEVLGALFPDKTPADIIKHLEELVKLEPYKDIKVMTSPSGATYLYSNTLISAANASEECLAEEVQTRIADKVREDSKEHVRLTPLESLGELAPQMPPDRLASYVATMVADETLADIKQLSGPTGIAYLYSDKHMTRTYANLLARVEANDTCLMIAETVREESRVYPRPTKVELFYAPMFKIDPAQMEMVVEQTLKRPEFHDIKKVVAPTQAVYLYSDKYMIAPQVERWVQYQEVERYQYQ